MTMLQWVFAGFAAVASGGVLMCVLIATNTRIPTLISTGHGLAALGVLALLFGLNLRGGDATPALAWWALGVMAGGFVGGLLLFRVLFRSRAPLPLALLHGSVGSVGLYLLYQAAF